MVVLLLLSVSRKSKISEDKLREAVSTSVTYREVLTKLFLNQSGEMYTILKRKIKEWGISTAHFKTGSDLTKWLHAQGKLNKRSHEDIFKEDSNVRREVVRATLIREGINTYECEECGQLPNWRGKKMSLILDHKNGVRNDNRILNLRFLCPNCNATLETHCVGVKKLT